MLPFHIKGYQRKKMTKALPSSPWCKLPRGRRLVLKSDDQYVDAFNKHAKPGSRINTSLVPEPFFGNLSAPVVLLLLNPGLGGDDARWHAKPLYRTRLANAVRRGKSSEHFHLLAEPEAPGTRWWRRACKELIDEVGLQTLATRLLAVEYFPYHSRTFAHSHVRLPSQRHAFAIVERAVQRGAEIVCMRGERLWKGAVPALEGYVKYRKLKSTRSSSLSRKNLPKFKQLVGVLQSKR